MLMLILLLLKLQLLWREIYEALYLFHYFHRRITKIGKKHHTTAHSDHFYADKKGDPEGAAFHQYVADLLVEFIECHTHVLTLYSDVANTVNNSSCTVCNTVACIS